MAVHAYCVMPDHVHLLLEPAGDAGFSVRPREGMNPSPTTVTEDVGIPRSGGLYARPSIIEYVRLVKGRSIAEARRRGLIARSFWQRSFFDHFLRREETIASVVRYIFMNPVRATLVDRWDQWHWSGSLVYPMETLREIVGEGRG
jgi:REP element-mobilizing transposase RayT